MNYCGSRLCKSRKSAVLYFTFQPEADLRNGEFFGQTLEEPRLWSGVSYSSKTALLFCARENPSTSRHVVSEGTESFVENVLPW